MLTSHVAAEKKAEAEKVVSFTPPEAKFFYDKALVYWGYTQYERSEFKHIPDPLAVASVDPLWRADLERMSELLDFYRDEDKRDAL